MSSQKTSSLLTNLTQEEEGFLNLYLRQNKKQLKRRQIRLSIQYILAGFILAYLTYRYNTNFVWALQLLFAINVIIRLTFHQKGISLMINIIKKYEDALAENKKL